MKFKLKIATFLSPSLFQVYQFISEYIGRTLGVETELITGQSYGQIQKNEFDLSFVCGLPYVLLTDERPGGIEPLAAPVLKGERYQNRPIYYSDVITKTEAPWDSFAEMRGRSWAYNEPKSQSGYGITLYTLLSMGETGGFFGEVVESGFHQKSIQMVAEGEVDGSAIDSHLLEVYLREHPGLGERIKIIDALGPSTIQPLVVDAGLPDSLKSDIQEVLNNIGNDTKAREALDFGMIERFEAVDDRSYDDIRGMWAKCEKAGFTKLR